MPVLICLRKELWTGLISVGDQVPTCPVFTRAKIKSHFGILVNLPSHYPKLEYTGCVSPVLLKAWGYSLDLFPTQVGLRGGWRCPWCNGYRRRKWTRRHEFKSWTRPIAFHKALISLGKVWIQLFSLQLWVNSRAEWVLQPWWGN